MKNVLSIAGSDCSAGAGIQADLKTFVANGVYGMTVITSLTAQNTKEVRMVEDVSIEMLKNQIETIFDVIKVSAIKIGMVNSKENGEIIYDELLKYKARNIVLDPVMIATSGNSLIKDETKDFLVNKLFKIVDIITPNLDETKEIVKIILNKEIIEDIDSIEKMKIYGKIIADFTKRWILIKGGHLSNSAVDILMNKDEIYILEGEKISSNNTHGTGCSLSSAIASNLAKGYSMLEAVKKAKNFVLYSIKNSIDFGEIAGTVNQMGEIYKNIDIEKLY
ncbi:bifunctional hydroxymethylpyrimidine kinase/phosphomethylpyrimidine kinase [Fusobacterium nucleatum]|uniref:bifunctional hydroxymethylpyrimidine kinase/phosphomethylpyrimidine kinase n=1 Tax=Fusobacterium vincentii TaxID=155615 RepID=UPI0003FF1D25|nr:bifunctional hydroxymethylpyrimidine kinase/phosphomethylpyrimidine kinase [Fusobacterium vincentii]ALF20398.1 hydroxymethylpyrimidine kinase [Fusobacterium vincentii ChDC F8]BEO93234.1 bifunctional hydroxymethylpyrimidine kinase/phosphomethylpyrimidine kinase [Fusobacterium nucleatum]BEP06317.1 bifunctional hydroxymethylpyrimidine kinase/phosphomethylpyrimidine kinase [Fusobacterium nucleatum]